MTNTILPVTLPFEKDLSDDPRDGVSGVDQRPDDWDALATARTRTVDACAGFEKMAEHTEPEFAPIVSAYLELHTRHAEVLTRILADAGRDTGIERSLMGTVNRMVVATRALFDDIDADVLSQIHSGERHVISAYQDALAAHLPATVRDQISGLVAELNELLADTRPIAWDEDSPGSESGPLV